MNKKHPFLHWADPIGFAFSLTQFQVAANDGHRINCDKQANVWMVIMVFSYSKTMAFPFYILAAHTTQKSFPFLFFLYIYLSNSITLVITLESLP